MSSETRVGVVGCGYWGPNLVRNFRALRGCTMAAVSDMDGGRLQHIRDLYPGIETYTSFDQMLADGNLQALAIATPVRLHFPLAQKALESGKHVFIEKPMAASVSECERLVEIAARQKLILMIGHTFLYAPAVRMVKEIVTAKQIGDIRYISCRRLNLGLFQKDINVTWDLAPHDISIILHLMDEMPSGVNCQGVANVTRGIEDICNLSLTFPSGRFACIQSSWLDPRKVREMTIVGTKKMIVYDDIEPREKIRIYDQRVERPPHYDTFGEFQYSYHYGDVLAPHIRQEEPLRIECQHFLDCIKDARTPISSGQQGLQLVKILEASSESLRHGGERITLGS
ncbi:MAG: Gfo/Idh/MocA family oxidoreductase [Lentisphaerae bacterium]|nr:Gfo/Idh/MocA family oxidoreductase [Lentisphaerota bacterium]